jgi:uncharacterized delta-60 repeat protein
VTATGVISCLVLLALPSVAAAQAGALDPSFGGDGKVTTDLTSRSDVALGLIVQGDGKLVVAGPASSRGRFALVRYADDGRLDDTFSSDGKVFTSFGPGEEVAADLALQTDGKLVAAGWTGDAARFALARYNGDGTLDSSFGGDGKVTTNFTPRDDFASAIAIQTDGKIVAVGAAGGSGVRFAAARYNDDGSLDTSFGGDGKVMTDFSPGYDYADAVALQADGKVVLAGTAGYFSRNARFALVRYAADGTRDSTFAGDGKLTTNLTARFDGAFAVAIQSADQKIVAAGQARLDMALLRYNPDGTLDDTFSGDGVRRTNFTDGLDYADDVALAADGKIVAAGTANWFGRNARFALARYDADGTLDTAFGGDGKVVTNFTASFDGIFDVEIQPADGKIVAAGAAGRRGAKFAVARYLGT